MGQLARDIQALLDTANLNDLPKGLKLGRLENADGEYAEIKSGRGFELRGEIARLFEDPQGDSRIAVAYLDMGQIAYGGAWTAIARDFYESDIEAVLMIDSHAFTNSFLQLDPDEQRRLERMAKIPASKRPAQTFDDYAKVIAACFSKSFIDAGMPIVYDQNDRLFQHLYNAEKLDVPEHVTYLNMKAARGELFADFACWREGICPVFDAYGSERECEVADAVAYSAIQDAYRWCSQVLQDAKVDVGDLTFRDIASFIDCVYDDKTSFARLADIRPAFLLKKTKYPIMCDDANGHVKRILHDTKLLYDACLLLKKAVFSAGYLPKGSNKDLDSAKAAYRKMAEDSGAIHEMEALLAGVPFEDIVA